jgi:hypothetical protein
LKRELGKFTLRLGKQNPQALADHITNNCQGKADEPQKSGKTSTHRSGLFSERLGHVVGIQERVHAHHHNDEDESQLNRGHPSAPKG